MNTPQNPLEEVPPNKKSPRMGAKRWLMRYGTAMKRWWRQMRKVGPEERLERSAGFAAVGAVVLACVEITIAAYHIQGGNALLYSLLPWWIAALGIAMLLAVALQ